MDLIMFCARYGHQDVDVMDHWPMSKLVRVAKSLGRIMERENKREGGFHESAATGGG